MRLRLRIAALAATLALTACGASTNEPSNGAGFEAGDGTVTIVPTAERVTPPTLAGSTLEQRKASTKDFAGKVVVINVWGSWCAPCRAEAPELQAAHEDLGEDVAFLGVNTRDLDAAPALAFQRSFKITYPSLFDPNGELLLAFGQLPPKAIPSTVVLDTEGRLAARVVGAVSATTLKGIVKDVQAP